MELRSIKFASLAHSFQVLTFNETGEILDSDERIVQVKNRALNLFDEGIFCGLESLLDEMSIDEEITYDCVETDFFGKLSHFDFTIRKLKVGDAPYALAIQDFGPQYAQMLAFRQERNLAEIHASELSKAHQSLNEALENEKASRKRLQIAQSQLVNQEKMASLGQLTSGIAHEINNPTNYIYNGINALEITLAPLLALESSKLAPFVDMDSKTLESMMADTKKLFDSIKLGAMKTSKIVRGLQLFSRQDAGEYQSIDLHENINITLMLVESELADRIVIEKKLDPDIREFHCNPAQINQVLLNILENAIHSIPKDKDGRITIQTISKTDRLIIIIKDNGLGMSEEVRGRIFEPFYTTKEVGYGTGLGLSISYGIIKEHRGSISVDSTPAKGSEFTITLPVNAY